MTPARRREFAVAICILLAAGCAIYLLFAAPFFLALWLMADLHWAVALIVALVAVRLLLLAPRWRWRIRRRRGSPANAPVDPINPIDPTGPHPQ